jgi:hypothetical protein
MPIKLIGGFVVVLVTPDVAEPALYWAVCHLDLGCFLEVQGLFIRVRHPIRFGCPSQGAKTVAAKLD